MNNVENHASLIFIEHRAHNFSAPEQKVKVLPGIGKHGHLNLHFFLGGVEGNAV